MDQKIFICYSRIDGEFAVRLDHDLDSAGFDSFLDQNDIPAGARWDEFVEKALKESTTVLVILSPSSVASQNVLDEIGYALREGKRVIPVLRKACQVPMRIDRLQHIDFTASYDAGFAQLTSALKADAATRTKRRRARADPPPPEPERPVEAVVVAPRVPDLPLQPIVEVTPPKSRKLLPAIFAVLLLVGAGALWVWRSVSEGAVVDTSGASTSLGSTSTPDTTNTTDTTNTMTTANATATVDTGGAPAPDTGATISGPTSNSTTITTPHKPVEKPKPQRQPVFECSEDKLPGCCRDSTDLAQCQKCKKQLDIPDRCE
ncbi:MAG TPA: toll/interleukin-1 receptor domain-containing protein [Thermoanaerobaculia bacterium]|nr:toll/interleukin-1 receptor domain-containing protein [Thermoanaerobaculia bacterium]